MEPPERLTLTVHLMCFKLLEKQNKDGEALDPLEEASEGIFRSD